MEKQMIDFLLKKIDELEKKVERYYSYLKVHNELDFILNGTYFLNTDVENLLLGKNKG